MYALPALLILKVHDITYELKVWHSTLVEYITMHKIEHCYLQHQCYGDMCYISIGVIHEDDMALLLLINNNLKYYKIHQNENHLIILDDNNLRSIYATIISHNGLFD